MLDGEIVVVSGTGLDFDALQQRLHPAARAWRGWPRRRRPRFVAFDLLAAGGRSTMDLPQSERRVRLERLLGQVEAAAVPDADDARPRGGRRNGWSTSKAPGLDGVIAKPEAAPYQPGKRAMLKIKHARTADCVVAGFRWYRDTQDAVGSLLLGLYDDAGVLQHVGVTSAFTHGDAPSSWPRNWRRCARTRWRTIPGATGPAPPTATPTACPARRAAGAPARTCRGSRCGPSASAR